MFKDMSVRIIYKNGAQVVINGVKDFEITIGGDNNDKVNWAIYPWSTSTPIIMNVGEVIAVYREKKQVWNPITIICMIVHKVFEND